LRISLGWIYFYSKYGFYTRERNPDTPVISIFITNQVFKGFMKEIFSGSQELTSNESVASDLGQ
jgi:hypothetical protein